jgi:hypothetical protein
VELIAPTKCEVAEYGFEQQMFERRARMRKPLHEFSNETKTIASVLADSRLASKDLTFTHEQLDCIFHWSGNRGRRE